MPSFTLTGKSGGKYVFNAFDASSPVNWNRVGGLYAFADREGWPKYIGQTGDFASRNPGVTHEYWQRARSYGASIILTMVLAGGEDIRRAAEADLIRSYDPPVNKQMRDDPRSLADLLYPSMR